jgi:hypothetical protein
MMRMPTIQVVRMELVIGRPRNSKPRSVAVGETAAGARAGRRRARAARRDMRDSLGRRGTFKRVNTGPGSNLRVRQLGAAY